MVFVKVVHCQEVRRFSLDSTAIPFGEFRARIARLFEEEAPEKVLLRYQDKDGDFVSVSSDEELQEAFRQLGEKEDGTIRFCMNVKGENVGDHHGGMRRHGFGRGSNGCPLLKCPAMFGEDGHCCPLLYCPAMFGRGGGCPFFNKGGYGRRNSCPFLACSGGSKRGCPMFSGRGGCPMFSGRGGCPMFSGHGGCPMFSGCGGCPMFSGCGGCPMFSGRGGCPMFSGRGGRPKFPGRGGCPMFSGGQHGDCPFLTKFHKQESDSEGENHGCPFFACPSMKSSHYRPDTEEESDEQQEEGAGVNTHHRRWGGWRMGGRPHGWGAGHWGQHRQPKKKEDQ